MLKNLTLVAAIVLVFSSLVSGQAANFGILVDNTGSMRNQFDQVRTFAGLVANQISAESPITIGRFESVGTPPKSAELEIDVRCSKDQAAVRTAIDQIYVVGGQTSFFDAIRELSNSISPATGNCGENPEKYIVIIGDGEDRASRIKPDELIRNLKEQNIRVLVIGLVDQLSSEDSFLGESPRKKAKGFFVKLAKDTGGKVVFPKKGQKPEDVVKELFTGVGKDSK